MSSHIQYIVKDSRLYTSHDVDNTGQNFMPQSSNVFFDNASSKPLDITVVKTSKKHTHTHTHTKLQAVVFHCISSLATSYQIVA